MASWSCERIQNKLVNPSHQAEIAILSCPFFTHLSVCLNFFFPSICTLTTILSLFCTLTPWMDGWHQHTLAEMDSGRVLCIFCLGDKSGPRCRRHDGNLQIYPHVLVDQGLAERQTDRQTGCLSPPLTDKTNSMAKQQ